MMSTCETHQKWKKNLPQKYKFDDKASLSLDEIKHLSKFYRSRYLYYIQLKMRYALDPADIELKGVSIYETDHGMQECKQVYTKLCIKLRQVKDSKETFESDLEQNTGSKQAIANQKVEKSTDILDQQKSKKAFTENSFQEADFESDSSTTDSLIISSHSEEFHKNHGEFSEMLLEKQELQNEKNLSRSILYELVEIFPKRSPAKNCETTVENNMKTIIDCQLPETEITAIHHLYIEIKNEVEEIVQPTQLNQFSWIKSFWQNDIILQEFTLITDLEHSDELWLSQLPNIYEYIILFLEASDKQLKQTSLINSLLFANAELNSSHLTMLAYIYENPLIKIKFKKQGISNLFTAKQHFKNIDLSLTRKWNINETTESSSAIEVADHKLVTLQVEVQVLLLKCKNLNIKFEKLQRSSIGNTLVQVRERYFYFFTKKYMNMLDDELFVNSKQCNWITDILENCRSSYQRINAMFINYGEIFTLTKPPQYVESCNKIYPEYNSGFKFRENPGCCIMRPDILYSSEVSYEETFPY